MSQNQNAPTVKANKGARFFNPGDRFNEPLNYSIEGFGDIHAIARWIIDAPAGDFFQVPTELRLLADGQRVSVDFPTTVLTKFKDRGVLMIDEEWNPGDDEEENDKQPFARDDKEAKTKGARLWLNYLQTIVKNHIGQCQRVRAMGGFPLAAEGFTKRAFKLLNMVDPATKEFESLQSGDKSKPTSSSEIEALKARLAEQEEMLTKALGRLDAIAKKKEEEQVEARTARTRS